MEVDLWNHVMDSPFYTNIYLEVQHITGPLPTDILADV